MSFQISKHHRLNTLHPLIEVIVFCLLLILVGVEQVFFSIVDKFIILLKVQVWDIFWQIKAL